MNIQEKRLKLKRLIKRKVDNNELIPLSFAQERVWFLSKLDRQSSLFNIPFAFSIHGNLNYKVLNKALNIIIERHVALQLRFQTIENIPYQNIPKIQKPFVLEVKEIADEKVLEKELQILSERTISLDDKKYFKMNLFKLSENKWVFSLVIHHIIFDGWSMNIFMTELANIYKAIVKSEDILIPNISTNFLECALQERIIYKATRFEKGLDYWEKRLLGCATLLDAPYEKSISINQKYEGAQKRLFINAELTQKLNEKSIENKRTLFSLFMAVYQIVLFRFSNQEDILVGYPVANRKSSETEKIMGFFVNTLVLYNKVKRPMSFKEFWYQTYKNLISDFNFSNIPFSKLVSKINPPRDGAYSPIFQMMLVFNNFKTTDLRVENITIEPLNVKTNQSAFFQTLYINPKNEGYECVLEYNKSLFGDETIDSFLTAFHTILNFITTDTEISLGRLPLKPIIEKVVNDELEIKEETIVSVFKKQIIRTPHKIAVYDGNESMTYQDLDRKSDQLAQYLITNLTEVSRIGVCLQSTVLLPVALLGILKAGGAYVPLDPSYPLSRLQYCIEQSGVSIIITDSVSEMSLQKVDNDKVNIAVNEVWGKEYPQNILPKVQRNWLAYILFTSGSTHQPKPVLGTHANTMNRLEWMWNKYPFTFDEVGIQRVSLNFVDSIWELFGPLMRGIPIRMASKEERMNLPLLIRLLQQEKISRLTVVPSLLKALIQHGFSDKNITTLKLCIVSGEKLNSDVVNVFAENFTKTTLLNLYGSTEVAGDVSFWEVDLNEKNENIPIGYPIEGNTFYVLDPWLEPLPLGFTGELYIGGEFLSLGYDNSKETAVKFIPNPFTNTSGKRFFKTGDLVQKKSDGSFLYKGRVDHLITIRGYRINPLEVEHIIKREFKDINDVVVMEKKIKENIFLVAYLTYHKKLDQGVIQRLEKRMFNNKLSQHLPIYMIPDVFIALDEMPKLYNGKTNRKGFPEVSSIDNYNEIGLNQNLTKVEQEISKIWKESLGIEKIYKSSNFFDLGGHSLLLQQIQPSISKVIGREISIIELFVNTTIADLAKLSNSTQGVDQTMYRDSERRANKRKKLMMRKRLKKQLTNRQNT